MSTPLPTLAITCGEPAGVGPELVATLAHHSVAAHPVAIGDRELILARAEACGHAIGVRDWVPGAPRASGVLDVLHVPLARASTAGKLDVANATHVLAILDSAIDGCMQGRFDAIVTAPLHKGVINDAGVPFTGHTEYLAERTGTPQVVMMLAGGGLRVALATTHLALKDVPTALTAESLATTIRILHCDLHTRFGLAAPRILVAGLNPHAGESGHMGREEIDVITPVLDALRAEGMALIGPLPADTLFTPHQLERGDAVLAMYHDQGLPVLKYASFGGGVNITLGLPIIRTSVDHGTALDLAGSGRADPGSLYAAIGCAVDMVAAQRRMGA
ncbi:4-hydroxythreonine-4-phosphate dehydrogenase PdxA [Niveibacterium umoris]|uniref:4-hydroxythreonine-4-phosphate dehydrogenase n=1 Tax=Niveibacterium umoris TaxID=1193620 RepID=A0A840BPY0_9RHOO|nr:4-hydroxythreonine-4-phosphate dehydrogenase PdxA [Niveibacterium umoris]MBB4012896.1 4-hydroxythreonine-4-phosphate dehydrogenase [Niveibacterium umoris]